MSFKKEHVGDIGSSVTRIFTPAQSIEMMKDGSAQAADLNQDFEIDTPSNSDLELVVETNEVFEFGDFFLHEKLGEGASAVVFRATHRKKPGSFALKVFRSGEERHGFDREKEVIERLAHPNIALHFGVGEHSTHRYVSMELVSGVDLETKLARKGIFQLNEVLRIIFQIATGLEHAHFRGLVHRDVKPSNIVVDDDGLAKLLDLGVSRDIQLEKNSGAESPATIGATIEFMPPELFDSHDVTPASDLFSLGATAYFLLTGNFFVLGEASEDRMSNLKSGIFNELDSLDLEQDVHAVFKKLLDVNLELRYRLAGDLIADLSDLMSDRGVSIPNRSVKILIVEDSQIDLMLTMRMLQKTNPSVDITRAVSLSESIQAIQDESFDLVLLDLNLPDSSGRDTVTKFSQANRNHIPLVVLSGDDVPDEKFSDEISGFINKEALNPKSLERNIFLAHAQFRAR